MDITCGIVIMFVVMTSAFASEHNATRCYGDTFTALGCPDATKIQISSITLYASTTPVFLHGMNCRTSPYDCAVDLPDDQSYQFVTRVHDECDGERTCDTLRADQTKLPCPGQTNLFDVSYISILYKCRQGPPSPSTIMTPLPSSIPPPLTPSPTPSPPPPTTTLSTSPYPTTTTTSTTTTTPTPAPRPSEESTTSTSDVTTTSSPGETTAAAVTTRGAPTTADEVNTPSGTASTVYASTSESTSRSAHGTNETAGSTDSRDRFPIEIAIAVPVAIVFLVILIVLIVCLVRRKRRKQSTLSLEAGDEIKVNSTARANVTRGASTNRYSSLSDNVQFDMFEQSSSLKSNGTNTNKDKVYGGATAGKNGVAIPPTGNDDVFEQVAAHPSNSANNDIDETDSILEKPTAKPVVRPMSTEGFNPYSEIGSPQPTSSNSYSDVEFKEGRPVIKESSIQDNTIPGSPDDNTRDTTKNGEGNIDVYSEVKKPKSDSQPQEIDDVAAYSEVNKPREQNPTEDENGETDSKEDEGIDDEEINPVVPSKDGLEGSSEEYGTAKFQSDTDTSSNSMPDEDESTKAQEYPDETGDGEADSHSDTMSEYPDDDKGESPLTEQDGNEDGKDGSQDSDDDGDSSSQEEGEYIVMDNKKSVRAEGDADSDNCASIGEGQEVDPQAEEE